MTPDQIERAAAALHLTPLGGVHEGGQTIILLGPEEPGFWQYISVQPDFDGADPMDNWSRKAITKLAVDLNAEPLFPFGGPPFHPFIDWAVRSGEAWQSPVGLLVHKDAGLLVSYRGALRFQGHVPLLAPVRSPCDACVAKPCQRACPVGALGAGGYKVDLCKSHIETDPVCRAACRVRMSCPISQSYARDPAQTAFHMEAFHPS